MPAGEPYPTEALGRILGGAVKGIGDLVQVPEALAGASVLTVASLTTQAHADVVSPATDQSRPLSLAMVSVAASGDRKSSSDVVALTPVRQREKTLREIYNCQLSEYKYAKKAYDTAISAAKKTKGDWKAIKEALKKVGSEPDAPLRPFLTADEPTLEGLHKLLEQGQPSMGLCSDEGGIFLGGFAMSAEHRLRTLAALSNHWDGADIRRIRAGDGAAWLVGKRLTFHLMVQPGVASDLLADPIALQQGFLSRVLVCAPSSIAGTRFQRPVASTSLSALQLYNGTMLDLLEKPFPMAPGAKNSLEPRRLKFDDKAASSWLNLCDAIEAKLGVGRAYEPIRGFANKLAEHIARLAGVITIVENANAGVINTDFLERATILGDFYASEALRLFDATNVTAEIQQAEKLLTWLQESWDEPMISLVDIYQTGPNSIRVASTAKKAVAILEQHGWLKKAEGKSHFVNGRNVRDAWEIWGKF